MSPAFPGLGTGASSRMTWALVPLMPKDETPARRGWPSRRHSRASVSRSTDPVDQSTCEERSVTFRVLGSTPCRIAMTILITPATPAAAWVCPMLDFSEPSHNGRPSGRCCP